MALFYYFVILGSVRATIDRRHVRHLFAVASHSNVQAAADAIHLIQPPLTKSIARFE